jgi:hypothetical protein
MRQIVDTRDGSWEKEQDLPQMTAFRFVLVYALQNLLFMLMCGLDSQWGENLVVADHDVWKRHRRILSPAFTKGLYVHSMKSETLALGFTATTTHRFSLVWAESTRTFRDMVAAEGWHAAPAFPVHSINSLANKVLHRSRCSYYYSLTLSTF